VQIVGYPGSAEEPFITPDGRYLLFNSNEEEPNFTLQYASFVNSQTFDYQGQILGEGVNEAGSLSGTPTLDDEGNLYFVSTRSYYETLSTIYTGRFSSGAVTDVHLVPGVSGSSVGQIDFDVGVSPDGGSLYISVGQFGGGGAPSEASIVLYQRAEGGSFSIAPDSARLLKAVNESGTLNYGAAISGDGLELFYTAATPALGIAPSVYRATRASSSEPFGNVEKISAITGFAEAPSLSTDGTTLYYHEKTGSEVHVMDVTRNLYTVNLTVTKVTPKKGPAAGGTPVRIKGSDLSGVTAVDFGAFSASAVHVESPTEVSAVSPPGASGEAQVSVTSPEGTSEPSGDAPFLYSAPTLSSISPSSGSFTGGTSVALHGIGFAPGTEGTTVYFGKNAASEVECSSTTSCTAVTPEAKLGHVLVSVSVGAKKSRRDSADGFTFEAP
jgi:IPT/TIG domain/WD40-like Beta Propeller Repeat